MCGVFGFVSYDSQGPDLKRLARIAEVTMARGPHAFGFAWLDWSGRLKMFKRTGRIVDHLALLAMAANARVLVGHCRWATHGDPANNLNNHPHPADGGWLVHNGVVTNHEELAAEYDLYPVTDCDSEVLGLLIAASRGSLSARCAATANVARVGPPGAASCGAVGQPAVGGMVRGGERYYLGSLPDELPGKVSEIPDRTGAEFGPSAVTAFDVTGEPSVV
jgi:glutamine---fructose-6-phosphate transaminase (isomerizing)